MHRVLKIGTRGSHLALLQTRQAVEMLRKVAPENHYEIVVIQSSGDRGCHQEVGAFTAELERAVLDGRVDIAVHSYKDLPLDSDSRLIVAAVLPRADPDDVLLSRLPSVLHVPGLNVGTSSNRRKSFLAHHHPGWVFHAIHGNIDTRIKQLREDFTLDAIVVAQAALQRGGFSLQGLYSEKIPRSDLLPAPAQGAIAVQCQKHDEELVLLCQKINHTATSDCVIIEREFLKLLGGGCAASLGCIAEYDHGKLEFSACWLDAGNTLHRGTWEFCSFQHAFDALAKIASEWLQK